MLNIRPRQKPCEGLGPSSFLIHNGVACLRHNVWEDAEICTCARNPADKDNERPPLLEELCHHLVLVHVFVPKAATLHHIKQDGLKVVLHHLITVALQASVAACSGLLPCSSPPHRINKARYVSWGAQAVLFPHMTHSRCLIYSYHGALLHGHVSRHVNEGGGLNPYMNGSTV